MSKSDPIEDSGPVGGFVFFISLLVLGALGSFWLVQILRRLPDAQLYRGLVFLPSAAGGFLFSLLIIPRRLHVFIHELKHSIVSNLAGNRARGMKVRSESGHFRYEYTKRTAAYNAFISLAPYWVPLVSVVAVPLAVFLLRPQPVLLLSSVGFAFGIDLRMNVRDISPVQTDITHIRGGYFIGLLYIFAINLTIMTLVASWVLFDWNGPALLLTELWRSTDLLIKALGRRS